MWKGLSRRLYLPSSAGGAEEGEEGRCVVYLDEGDEAAIGGIIVWLFWRRAMFVCHASMSHCCMLVWLAERDVGHGQWRAHDAKERLNSVVHASP